MREEVVAAIACDNLCMTLVEEREGTPGRAGVDCLPQPIEDENRLIEQCVHDLVVSNKLATISAAR